MAWQKEEKITYGLFLDKHKRMLVFFSLLFIILSLRLSYLQIIQGNYYRAISQEQSMYNRLEKAPRGIIYASDGTIFVSNDFTYAVLFKPFDIEKVPSQEIIYELSSILGRDISATVNKNTEYGRVVKLADNLSIEEMFKIREKQLKLKGVEVVKEPKRLYNFSESSSHITGYIGEIRTDELRALSQEGYKLGDYIGRGGIEQSFDKYLQGIDGGWQLEINAKGYQTKAFKYIDPQIGNSLYITINPQLQKIAYEALQNSPTGKGAAVVIDIRSGAILAMVSAPNFDANLVGTDEFNNYLKDKKLPLFNRAMQALYAPGSIFKIVTVAAALEVLSLDPDWTVYCNGKFELGDRVYACWKKEGHGKVDLKKGLAQSCNVYMYNLALKLGIKNLDDFAEKFHLGEITGIDIPNEKKGFVPTPEWKKAKIKMSWLQGDTVIFAIGQGALWATPLQMASMMSAVANRGTFYKPFVVNEVMTPEGKPLYRHTVETGAPVVMSDETWDILQDALLESVESGTSQRSKFRSVRVAGKTGTAQNPQGDDHAWFVSYAPFDNPEIALAVIVENGGGGGAIAVPVGRAIYEAYFDLPPQPLPVYRRAETKTNNDSKNKQAAKKADNKRKSA
ncbi:MAG: penicillin-binding protein 2 [Elusimicrobiota bacterium]|jgi:penicillin-binding protein 2|nr:penicillin-binding protein 2 [Elusimicrobiota bacterium]